MKLLLAPLAYIGQASTAAGMLRDLSKVRLIRQLGISQQCSEMAKSSSRWKMDKSGKNRHQFTRPYIDPLLYNGHKLPLSATTKIGCLYSRQIPRPVGGYALPFVHLLGIYVIPIYVLHKWIAGKNRLNPFPVQNIRDSWCRMVTASDAIAQNGNKPIRRLHYLQIGCYKYSNVKRCQPQTKSQLRSGSSKSAEIQPSLLG